MPFAPIVRTGDLDDLATHDVRYFRLACLDPFLPLPWFAKFSSCNGKLVLLSKRQHNLRNPIRRQELISGCGVVWELAAKSARD